MKQLKKRSGQTEDTKGCEFEYTLYQTLKPDWFLCPKGQEYEKLYIEKHYDIRAETLNELKKKMGEI